MLTRPITPFINFMIKESFRHLDLILLRQNLSHLTETAECAQTPINRSTEAGIIGFIDAMEEE